jgi:hypothetical protein
MVRGIVISLVVSCLATTAFAQTQPAPAPAASTAKSVPKKPAAKQKSATTSAAAEASPCRIGVISTIGQKFGVQKMGITVFGNGYVDAPIDTWALDDLVVARVRATAGAGVKRIAYAKNTFDEYENSKRPEPHRRVDQDRA